MAARASATLSKGDDASDMAADFSNLLRGAARLKAQSGQKSGFQKLPALLFLTDPDRAPHPIEALKRLPRCADGRLGVIYRHFGAPDRLKTAKKLKTLCNRRKWTLLIGADANLAARIGADGVHLPERLARTAQNLKRRRPTWIVTAAAHSRKGLTHSSGLASGLDAILLSPAFPTESPSAKGKKALRRRGLAEAARHAKSPIYALGGVNGRTSKYLENIRNIGGAALVSGLFGDA
jgi:thiamine-phosphate pyrophosphorylase